MLIFRVVVCVLLFHFSCIPAFSLEPDEVFAKVSAGIVAVAAATKASDSISRASGIIVGPGEIVTTCSAIENATFIAIARDKFKAFAKLRFADPQRDLCQLSVGKGKGFDGALSLNATVSDLRVGQKVYAIGARDGIQLTLTDGIVSSIRASNTGGEIQTTTPIWSGSSGGGLFDSSGNLVGVTNFDRTQNQYLSVSIAAHWIAELPSLAVDLMKKEKLRFEKEQRCLEQIERRIVESFWDDESESILDPNCERVKMDREQRRADAIKLEEQIRQEEKRIVERQRQEAELNRLELAQKQRFAEQQRLRKERDLVEKQRQEELAKLAKVERVRKERARADLPKIVDEFKAKIAAKVRSRVEMPSHISGNPVALYEVVLFPGGDVLSATLKKSSGVPAYDAAVHSAIMAAQPLPVPSDPNLFQDHFLRFNMKFRPKK